MIVDNIKNCGRYMDGNKNIAAALKFIAGHAQDTKLQDGSYSVIEDEVIAHVLTKETHSRNDVKMEIHKNFMDIHYIIQGTERCGIAPLPAADEIDYDAQTDNGFWSCKDRYSVLVGEGEFYAVWPMEPHCPLCSPDGQSQSIRKIICKVKVDEERKKE